MLSSIQGPGSIPTTTKTGKITSVSGWGDGSVVKSLLLHCVEQSPDPRLGSLQMPAT